MNKLTEIQKAYIAGIVDGEGHIGISEEITFYKGNGKRYVGYKLHTQVTNTYHEIIYWLIKVTGIGKTSDHHENSIRWKKAKRWSLKRYEIREFLSEILPYLIIKKRQAELMLEFLETKRKVGVNKPLPEEIIITRAVIFEEMKELNERGK